MKHYTEALARGPPKVNPEAHKLYSNRAACYTKLGAWDAGLKDADECIALKPDFAKGYVRKVPPIACCVRPIVGVQCTVLHFSMAVAFIHTHMHILS